MTKEIWGDSFFFFFFGGDKKAGVKDKDLTAEKHPREVAEALFDLVKSMVLLTYIHDDHGRRAKVSASMLKRTLGRLMNDEKMNLKVLSRAPKSPD